MLNNLGAILSGILAVMVVLGVGILVITKEKSIINAAVDYCVGKTGIIDVSNIEPFKSQKIDTLNCSDHSPIKLIAEMNVR